MEGAPLFPVEDEKVKRFESLDVDDDSKDKKKKKKRSDASAIHSRIDTEKPQELQEKRQNARKELGELSLSGLFDKQENDKKPFVSEDSAAVIAQVINVEKNDYHEPSNTTELAQEHEIIEIELPTEEHPELQTETRIEGEEEAVSEQTVGFSGQEESSYDKVPEQATGVDIEDISEQEAAEDRQVNQAQSTPVIASIPAQPSVNSQPSQPRVVITPPTPSRARQSIGGSGNPPTPPTPPGPPVSPRGSAQPSPNSGGMPNFNQPPIPPYGGNPNTAPGMPLGSNPNIQPQQLPTPENRPVVIEKHNHFLAGLIVGGLYEHFKHRKREKQLKKDTEQAKQDIVGLQSQQFKDQEQIKKAKTELVAVQEAQQKENEPVIFAPRISEKQTVIFQEQKTPSTTSRVGEIVTDTIKAAAELVAVPLVVAAEQARVSDRPRSAEFVPGRQVQEQLQNKPESVPPSVVSEDEPLNVAEGAHVEMSSWHRIEVDNKTGKAVENPATAYGHEFEVEHRQETRGSDTDAGVQAGVQAVSLGSSQVQNIQQPINTNATAQTLPSVQASAATNSVEETQKITQDSNGPIIGLSIALVGAIGLLIFVLL